MNFADILVDSNFRVSPLRQESDELVSAFQQAVVAVDADVINKHIIMRLAQTVNLDPLDVVWRMQREATSLQIDLYRQMGESALSFVALDCRVFRHEFALSYENHERLTHRIELRARNIIRLGAGGDLSYAKLDGHSDEDLMLTKLIMLPPKE